MTKADYIHDLRAEGLTLGYGDMDVTTDLDVAIPDGRITMVIGANCLREVDPARGLARLLRPRLGAVILDGTSVQDMRTIDVARIL